MSEQNTVENSRGRKYTTRGVLLLTLMVGLASGLVAYEVASIGLASGIGLNTTNLQTADANNSTIRWGQGGCGRGFYGGEGLVFGARSEVSNVTVTGFTVSGTNQLTVNIAYTGTGTTPSITVNGIAYGVSSNTIQNASGSTVVQSGWTSPTTVTITLTGTGSVTPTTARHVAVLIVPYTGA